MEGDIEVSKEWEESRIVLASDGVVSPLKDRWQDVSFRLGIFVYPTHILRLKVRETKLSTT